MAETISDLLNPGSIQHTRKQLAFLKTITLPSPMVLEMIRQHEAEVAAYEYDARRAAQQKAAGA